MNLSLKRINEWFALALLITLSFSNAYPNIIVGVFFIAFMLDKKRKFAINKAFLTLGVLFIYLLIKAIVNECHVIDYRILVRFLIVFIVPILLYSIERIKIMLYVLISVIVAIIISLSNTLDYYLKYKKIPFNSGEVINKILVLERPYLGFFCLLGLISCFFLISKKPSSRNILIPISILILVFIVLIAARLSLISIGLISLTYLFFYSKVTFLKKGIIIVSGVLIVAMIFLSYKNVSTRFFTNASLEKMDRYDPRIDIWDCAYEITKKPHFNWLTGCQSYEVINLDLVECYKSKSTYDLERRAWFVKTQFNTHNQFIDFYLVGGAFSLCLFIALLYFIFKASIDDFYSFSIVLSLTLFFIFENVFHRQFGCYLIAIIFSILFYDKTMVISKEDTHKNALNNKKQ